ncbi:hypothetical protein ACIPPM_02670 [Streptomyces sp. NPDC090119]|uniref:hypothetical protein n=1 Tax=Streptomyces sp. NPDC090119 TaxID=3365951 RepID=UPI00382B7E34
MSELPDTDVPLIAGATRMLLAGDGSTTLLLEALLDTRLTVHVERQEKVPGRQLGAAATAALGLPADGAAVLRVSTLRTPAGHVVSRNTVAFTAPPAAWSGSADDLAPLGRRLREGRTRQHREILSAGTARWREGGQYRPCAYKEYVITCDDGARLYVHERFAPDRVRPLPDPRHPHRLPRTG